MQIFSGLSNQTEILESLDWDEEKLQQLTDFIDSQNLLFLPTHPTVLLDQIEEFFGLNTRKVLEKIFKSEIKKIKEEKTDYENWFNIFFK